MKVKQVTIHNFKSIRKDFVLDVDKRVTALVGASESGKTNVLKALQKFSRATQYQDDDFCTFCGREPARDCQMVSVVLDLMPDETAPLASRNPQAGGAKEIAITKSFGGEYHLADTAHAFPPWAETPREIATYLSEVSKKVDLLWAMVAELYRERGESTPGSEFAARIALYELNKHLWRSSEFTPLRRSEGGDPFTELLTKWRGVQKSLTQLPDQTPQIDITVAELNRAIQAPLHTLSRLLEPAVAVTDILDLAPQIVYLHDQDVALLENSVPIAELERSPQNHKTTVSLLALAGLTVQDLKISDATRRRRRLKSAGAKVSKMLNLVWLQELVSLEFDVTGEQLHVAIQGKEGHYGPFSDRSEGFQWFLSFYVNFASSNGGIENTVLLLDEPGIHLHAAGQKDLLQAFEEIAKSAQIMYATHSPYMINKNFPQRIRAVLKGGINQGTYVENKAYRPAKGGPYEPIRSAIGLSLGNSLFLGMKNLIVEGISDHILIAAVSRRLAGEDKKPPLDLQEICITPAGGAQNVPYFAYLVSHEDMKTVVLLDSDGEGDKAANRIEKEGILSTENVVRVTDVVRVKKGEIFETLEDLLQPDFYWQGVDAAYKDVKGTDFAVPGSPQPDKKSGSREPGEKTTTKNNLAEQTKDSESAKRPAGPGKEGIVKQCSRLFQANDALGDFDKVLVAKKVAEMLDNGESLDDESAKRFQKLFNLVTQKIA